MKLVFAWLCALAVAAGTGAAQADKSRPSPGQVVFVCEHGAAKSVIAAAWFNKMAGERRLPFYAIARGTTPQAELSESAAAGLRRDGVQVPLEKPQALTAADLARADRVVAFCTLPKSAKSSRIEQFDVPPPSDGYERSRDAILVHVRSLLDDLQKSRAPR